ncbi:MAG: hypothetical protein LAQ30_30265, partial [Acidobacteriia bacterium]|nr:hypothetical protein [Terriglobia bacterium]
SACLGGFVGLSLWSIRAHMRKVRWGIVLTILALAVVMKAPIFYIIAKVDFVGGHGWDRAFLVDQFVQHLSDWWLVGTDQNGTWSHGTWDRCNQYVAEAASGGVITLGLFIALISRGFGIAGRARKRSSGKQAWLAWCIGSALFAHVVAFQGVSYWDQMKVPWLLFLAMFPPLDCMTPGGRAATGDKATSGDTPVSAPPEGAGEATGAAQRVLA